MLGGKLLFQVLISGKEKPTSVEEKFQDFASFIIISVIKVGIAKKK